MDTYRFRTFQNSPIPRHKFLAIGVSCEYYLQNRVVISFAWWRHQMETFPPLLALCAGNSPVTGEFPSQRPVTRSFGVFFDLHRNKQLSKLSRRPSFETSSRPLWRHCNYYIPMNDGPLWGETTGDRWIARREAFPSHALIMYIARSTWCVSLTLPEIVLDTTCIFRLCDIGLSVSNLIDLKLLNHKIHLVWYFLFHMYIDMIFS